MHTDVAAARASESFPGVFVSLGTAMMPGPQGDGTAVDGGARACLAALGATGLGGLALEAGC